MNHESVINSLKERGFRVDVIHRRPVNTTIEIDRQIEHLLDLGEDPREWVTHVPMLTRQELASVEFTPEDWNGKGGITRVEISNEELGDVYAEGTAQCRPDDNFNRAIGLQIALGRALKALSEIEA